MLLFKSLSKKSNYFVILENINKPVNEYLLVTGEDTMGSTSLPPQKIKPELILVFILKQFHFTII